VEGSTVISNTVQSQLCWYIDKMNVEFTFLYAVFYNCRYPLGFLKGEQFMDWWSGYNLARKYEFCMDTCFFFFLL
jgi:hypothetical protein